MNNFKNIYDEIVNDPDNIEYTKNGYKPLYQASSIAKILIIGQAPGEKAQERGKLFDDESGKTLREWLGINEKTFYDDGLISILPMDFYFPGHGKSGDLPPRKGFSQKWHPKLLKLMPNLKLTILIGNYALKEVLKDRYNTNLTTTVLNYKDYLPTYFPLIHPSKRNFRWHLKNKWFLEEVIPNLKEIIKKTIA